jgi:molecular chaperone GrpE
MTAEKRHIPINHSAAGNPGREAAHAPTGPHGATHGPAGMHGASQAPAGPAKLAGAADLKSIQAELDTLVADCGKVVAERDVLAAERDALRIERDALRTERDALADKLLRQLAEFDNFRKRATREGFEARTKGQCDLLTDLLPVLDNLERALDAAEHHEEGKVLGGVRMTRDMFVDLLTRIGVEEIAGVGAQFDPQMHDAMLVQPSEQEEGTVTNVLERGYRQGERVLRPARVVVAGPGSREGSGGTGAGLGGADGATG